MIKFEYRNHRGEIKERTVDVMSLIFDYSQHPEYGYVQPAWYLVGDDLTGERINARQFRSFNLNNIVVPPPTEWTKPYTLALPSRFGIPIP